MYYIIPVEIPSTFLEKKEGMLKYNIPPNHGMLFLDINSIHMIGMKFPLMVAFLDRNHQVIDVQYAPIQIPLVDNPLARHTLELPIPVYSEFPVKAGDEVRFKLIF